MDAQHRHIEPVDNSQFMMWRCITAMAHADGVVTVEEKEYLTKIYDRMGLNDEQRTTLLDDLENAHDVGEFLPQINDPKYRSQIVYFARILAFKDGEIDPNEEKLIEKLHYETIGQVDIDQVREDVHKTIEQEMEEHRQWLERHRPELNFSKGKFMFHFIDYLARRWGYDVLLD